MTALLLVFQATTAAAGPQIELEQQISGPVDNLDGSYSATIELTLRNSGDEYLRTARISNDLDIFGNGRLLNVGEVELLAGDLLVNSGFDGRSDISLLADENNLRPGHEATLRFALTFEPGDEAGPFINSAVAHARGAESGRTVDAVASSRINLPDTPGVGLQHDAGDVVANGDGSLGVPITLTISNIGSERLVDLDLGIELDIFTSGGLLSIGQLDGGDLALNSDFSGGSSSTVLAGGNELEPGESATVTFTLNFDPGIRQEPFTLSGQVTGLGRNSGQTVSDTDEATFLPRQTRSTAAISLVHTAGDPVRNDDGSLSVLVEMQVINSGNEDLDRLQIRNVLKIFDTGSLLGVENLQSQSLTLNSDFDGDRDLFVLEGRDILPRAGAAVVSFTLRFEPAEDSGPFLSSAVATANGVESGIEVEASSTASFSRLPTVPGTAISVINQVGDPSRNDDGSFSSLVTLIVTNTGEEALTSLQIDDDFDIFGSGRLLSTSPPAVSNLTANPGFDGLGRIELLTGVDRLEPGAEGSISFTATFDPAGESGPFLSVVVATGVGEMSGNEVEGSATASFLPAGPPPGAAIRLVNQAGDPSRSDAGNVRVPVSLIVTNTGDEPLISVQIDDDLDIFGSGELLEISDLMASGLTPNPAYDGVRDRQLLVGTDRLAPGTGGSITFTAIFDPGMESGPFPNTSTGTATGETSGTPVSDGSETLFELPADEPPLPPDIAVSKSADREFAIRGDLVGYDVVISNLNPTPLANVEVVDRLPAGFSLVADASRLIRAGSDGIPGTGDDIVEEIVANGANPVVFDAFDLAADERVLVRYAARIGTGVGEGEHTNEVIVTPSTRTPVISTAVITITPDPVFEQTSVIGKVYHDQNENGVQDPDEAGVPGARLATVGGLVIETDSHGRFHLAEVDVTRTDRGDNFILKLDESSLPTGSTVISENPRVIRLTQALMSKLNFGVKLPAAPLPPCYQRCMDIVPKMAVADIDPVPFPSGISVIPTDFEQQLENLMLRYQNKQRVQLIFTGHTDNDPVGSELARELRANLQAEADSQTDNRLLSVQRALAVCQHVRDQLGFAADCENVRGEGARKPIASNATRAGKARNRRVEISVQYYDIIRNAKTERVSAAQCADINVSNAREQWASWLDASLAIEEAQTLCVYDYAAEEPFRTATAKMVRVSGGDFGCDTLVDDVLPGRIPGSRPADTQSVTVYATGEQGDRNNGAVCSQASAAGGRDIVVGAYPIQLETGAGSVLQITAAGDVQRVKYPDNNERIVVTPFRDESDVSVVSALRVFNDGTEPDDTQAAADGLTRGFTQAFNSVEPQFRDPRLDVLALGPAAVRRDGRLNQPVAFAYYTNYAYYLKHFALHIYGRSAAGFDRRLLQTITTNDYRFEQSLNFDGDGIDLSQYSQLEYVLRAYDCEDPQAGNSCRFDETQPRVLKLQSVRAAPGELHSANELWGQSNLAAQRIPVDGSRVRINGVAGAGEVGVWIGSYYVPVGNDDVFVLEQHLPSGKHAYNIGATEESAQLVDTVVRTAEATNIRVSGGPFGCQQMAGGLPGSDGKDRHSSPALTVVADPSAYADTKSADTGNCPGEARPGRYPIVVETGEGTALKITAAGDVIRSRSEPSNNQHIVVTPFRDESDNSIISALRIVNEGAPSRSAGFGWPEREPDVVVDVADEYGFLVALGSLTLGQNSVSGNDAALASDGHYDGDLFADGRIAFYGKGVVKDKYHVTAQLDSTEDELRNLTDHLRRKDPRRIFRQLDPDRYYAIYGDDSTTVTDVDTQGAMYLRVDWDRNTALWGNYNTGLVDTEFMQYNRSLYGGFLRHESQQVTEFGDAKSELTLFGSEAQSAAAHVTFKATGGSLYYLRNTDIVMGSEKVSVEVRRRDTQQVVEREILFQGRDYEVDPIQGRIILSRPLSQVVADRGNSIIRSTPLEGDEVYLLVDYEYVPLAFEGDQLTYGARGKYWFKDYLGAGVTTLADERNGSDYELNGVDVTLRSGEGTYLKAEIARSKASQNDANFISVDGGLNFQSQSIGSGDDIEGDAVALEGRVNLAEVSDDMNGDVRAWWKTRDAGFSTGRLDQGFETTDFGFEAFANVFDTINFVAGYADFERESISREQVTRVQADGTFGQFSAGLEVRHEDVEQIAMLPFAQTSGINGAIGSGEALLVGGRVGYEVGDDTTLYAAGQVVADDSGTYDANNLFSVGVNTQLNDQMAINFEASDGDRGSALLAGFDIAASDGLNFNISGGVGSGAVSQFSTRYAVAEGHELYGSYTVDPDRTDGQRNLLTLGQRSAFGNSMDIFAETQYGKTDRYANTAHVFGLEFDGFQDWRISGSMQFSENQTLGLEYERRAASIGAYLQKEQLRLASRLEYREDIGANVHTRQWITSNSFTHIIADDQRWLGQLNLSWTDDEMNGGRDARFVEFNIGYAHRPLLNDRFNLLAKYTFLFDLPTNGQATLRPDERSHVVSVEGLFDLNTRWELGSKIAVKSGDRRLFQDSGPWFDFGLLLSTLRTRYHLTHKWDALAEYRWLKDVEGENDQHGALLGLYRQFGEHVKVGAGFNFTDFNDDLRIDDYSARGWFLDIIGKY